jgi:hypothetical protein
LAAEIGLRLWRQADEVRHAGVAAVVARRLDLGIQRLGRAPLVPGRRASAFKASLSASWNGVSLLGLSLRRYFGGPSTWPCSHFGRVARQPRDARNLALALVAPAMQSPDLANHVHGDHSSSPAAQKRSRAG